MWWKFNFAPIQILMKWLLQIVAHDMAAILSWLVKSLLWCDGLEINCNKMKFSWHSSCKWKIGYWNGPQLFWKPWFTQHLICIFRILENDLDCVYFYFYIYRYVATTYFYSYANTFHHFFVRLTFAMQHDVLLNAVGMAWWRHQMGTFSALLALCIPVHHYCRRWLVSSLPQAIKPLPESAMIIIIMTPMNQVSCEVS